MYGQVRAFIDQCGEKIDEIFRVSVIRAAALTDQPRAAIEVPSNKEYRGARFDKGFAQRTKVTRAN